MNELKKRILVGIIGIPISILVMWLGGIVFNFVILVLSTIALGEFYKLSAKKNYPAKMLLGIILNCYPIILYSVIILMNINLSSEKILGIVLISVMFLFIVPLYFLFNKKENTISGIGVTFTGFIYVSLSFFVLVLLRNMEDGFYYMVLTFASIWICDSVAYFIGRKYGKHKLMPSVSPKKSIEGAITGFVASSVFFMLMSSYFFQELSLTICIVLGIIIGIFGQIGDLVESKLKRDADVKDSSNLIPGHGGILDRFDSIIFVVPFVYVIILIYTF
jgi:phosphatidate cytidylyltransferase